MPWYEYRCSDCGETFSLQRPMQQRDEPAACPACGSERSRRELSSFLAVSTGPGPSGSGPSANNSSCCGGFA